MRSSTIILTPGRLRAHLYDAHIPLGCIETETWDQLEPLLLKFLGPNED